jgi:hypothetical protein
LLVRVTRRGDFIGSEDRFDPAKRDLGCFNFC